MATSYWDYKVPISLFSKTRKFLAYHLSFRQIMRDVFRWMNSPFYDCACPDASTIEGVAVRPTRWNDTDDVLERLSTDGTTWEEIPTSAEYTPPTGYTGTIAGVDGDWEFDNGVLIDFTPAP
jgi:hypothetical protein